MKSLSGQIAVGAAAVAAVVGVVLTVGTLVFARMSFAELMVDHGETLASAQAMFQDSVTRVFVAALVFAALACALLAVAVGRRVAAPLHDMSEAVERRRMQVEEED